MVVTLENGNTIEATTVGSDGFVGLSVSLGTERADVTAMVQVAGDALRMDVNAFRSCLEEPQFRASVGRYTAKVFATIAQSTACIAFHPLQERLARWLLQVREGVEGDEFVLTQDFLAIMLGVHRPTVTIAIRMLEGAGLIEHHRGRIRIVDAAALTEAACECARLPRIALSEA
jgi:CRP-like cAMP-binding protein